MASVNAEPASPEQQQLHCRNKIQRFNFISVSQYAGRWPEAEQQWGQWWRTGLCQECLKEHISKVKQHNRQLLLSSAKIGNRVFVATVSGGCWLQLNSWCSGGFVKAWIIFKGLLFQYADHKHVSVFYILFRQRWFNPTALQTTSSEIKSELEPPPRPNSPL